MEQTSQSCCHSTFNQRIQQSFRLAAEWGTIKPKLLCPTPTSIKVFSENSNAEIYLKHVFYVSQGTVKKFSDEIESIGILTDLLRTINSKFCQNHASFMGDMTMTFWLTCYCDSYWNSRNIHDFQVSVETLYQLSWETLQLWVTNIFRDKNTNNYENRPIFDEFICKCLL